MAIRSFSQAEKVKQRPMQNAQKELKTLDEALKLPDGVSRDEFFARLCPPLPANYEIPGGEPESLLNSDARNFRTFARQKWTDEQWRMHRWAYARLTEVVDAQIGKVLAALAEAGLEKNTLVIFTSDHGDMDASHRLEHKSVCYEEASRVPLLVCMAGATKAGLVDREHLVSTGLDILPTMCDFAGIAPPAGLDGQSIRPARRRPIARLVAQGRDRRKPFRTHGSQLAL